MDFKDLFDKDDFDKLPERRPYDHVIELIKGAKPVDCKIYLPTLAEQEELDKFIEENLCTGRICPSRSPMASPFFFIKKKDGSLQPVQDYRKLNDMTVKNRYLLPLIQELLDKPKGARFFSKLDVRWGYNNVRIAEGDEWKAAFRTNCGLFEPTVMFFGLTNSPATFQAMIVNDGSNPGRETSKADNTPETDQANLAGLRCIAVAYVHTGEPGTVQVNSVAVKE